MRQLERFQNPNRERLLQLVGSFDADWRKELDEFIIEERATAISSVMNNRNQIAHGGQVTVSYSQVRDWYKHIDEVVQKLSSLYVP